MGLAPESFFYWTTLGDRPGIKFYRSLKYFLLWKLGCEIGHLCMIGRRVTFSGNWTHRLKLYPRYSGETNHMEWEIVPDDIHKFDIRQSTSKFMYDSFHMPKNNKNQEHTVSYFLVKCSIITFFRGFICEWLQNKTNKNMMSYYPRCHCIRIHNTQFWLIYKLSNM